MVFASKHIYITENIQFKFLDGANYLIRVWARVSLILEVANQNIVLLDSLAFSQATKETSRQCCTAYSSDELQVSALEISAIAWQHAWAKCALYENEQTVWMTIPFHSVYRFSCCHSIQSNRVAMGGAVSGNQIAVRLRCKLWKSPNSQHL